MLVLSFLLGMQFGIQLREKVLSIFRVGLPITVNQDDFSETCAVAVFLDDCRYGLIDNQ